MVPHLPWSRSIRLWQACIILHCFLGISACSPGIEPALQTPITQETLRAYKPIQAIKNSLQAGIAAQQIIEITRISYDEPPKVIFDQKLSYKEAKKLIFDPIAFQNDKDPKDMQVWLVIFEGEFRITPPSATPGPLQHGCVQVILNSADGTSLHVGGLECKIAK